MSFGALSYEAKTALARGSAMAGSATCSGEGGMIPDERRYSQSGIINVFNQDMALTPITLNWPML
jgi:glutamate synthase domain-containing protein 2